MSKQLLGAVLQLSGGIALACGALWSTNTVKVLIVAGVVAYLVGNYMNKRD